MLTITFANGLTLTTPNGRTTLSDLASLPLPEYTIVEIAEGNRVLHIVPPATPEETR